MSRGRIPGWGKAAPSFLRSFCLLFRDKSLGKEQKCVKKNY